MVLFFGLVFPPWLTSPPTPPLENFLPTLLRTKVSIILTKVSIKAFISSAVSAGCVNKIACNTTIYFVARLIMLSDYRKQIVFSVEAVR